MSDGFMSVSLKSNGWYCKLQTWTFGDNWDPMKFGSLCPFFWLTIFCILVIPFIGTYKGCYNLFMFIGMGCENLFRIIDENICIPLYEFNIKHYSNKNLFEIAKWKGQENNYWDYSADDRKKFSGRLDVFKRIFKGDWEKRLEEARVEGEKRKAERLKIENEKSIRKHKEQQIRNKQMQVERKEREARDAILKELARKRAERYKKFINGAIIWTQKLTPYAVGLLVTVLSVAVVFGTYKAGVATVDWWKPHYTDRLWWLIKLIILTSLASGAVIFTVIASVRYIKKCDLSMTCPLWLTSVGDGFKYFWKVTFGQMFKLFVVVIKVIGSPFRSAYIGIAEFTSFIVMYLKSTKDDYCPAINWDKK